MTLGILKSKFSVDIQKPNFILKLKNIGYTEIETGFSVRWGILKSQQDLACAGGILKSKQNLACAVGILKSKQDLCTGGVLKQDLACAGGILKSKQDLLGVY